MEDECGEEHPETEPDFDSEEEGEWDDYEDVEDEGEWDSEDAEYPETDVDDETELDEALLELEAACEAGDEDACEELASIFMDDEGNCDDEDDVEDAEVETPEI